MTAKIDDDDGRNQANLSRGELVHLKLLEAIRTGAFAPGDRVREADVAEWLNVSRAPVRTAFRQLQADGLLVMEPWRGGIVAQLDQQQLIELYAIRQVLEGAAAGLAAQHASESQIATLNDIIAQADDTTAADERAELNQIFHQYIYAAAHNRYLLQALNTLRDAVVLLPSTTYALDGRHGEAEAVARHHIGEAEKAHLKMVIALEREQKHDKEGIH